MNRVVVLVGFRELFAIEEQGAEAVGRRDLENLIHLDGVEGADLDADLAAHANGSIDVKDCWIQLGFAGGVRFIDGALVDVDAFRRALLLADLARDATERAHGINGVFGDEEREIAVGLGQLRRHLRILERRETRGIMEAAREVLRGDGQSFDYSGTEHVSKRAERLGKKKAERLKG